jgi:hypothetical protein
LAKRKSARIKPVKHQTILDATPERLAKGDYSEFIDPAKIDSSEQPIGRVRRFRASHLDRLYGRGTISGTQYDAGDWYRNQYARSRFALSCVGSYGERTSAGEPSYGLPRTEAQARARQMFRAARSKFPLADLSLIERLLIENELPLFGGRVPLSVLNRIRRSLDQLAEHLFLPVDELAVSMHKNTIVANCATKRAA